MAAANHQPDFNIIDTNEATEMDDDTGSHMAIPKYWGPDFEREDTHTNSHIHTITLQITTTSPMKTSPVLNPYRFPQQGQYKFGSLGKSKASMVSEKIKVLVFVRFTHKLSMSGLG